MRTTIFILSLVLVGALPVSTVCAEEPVTNNNKPVRLITLDPGHFHAALVQKTMYDEISPTVYVYAPDGPDVKNHLNLIEGFNTREQNPTSWVEKVYTGDDYLAKMLSEKNGNVAILAGNNKKKTEYIEACVDASLNVLSDKPMCIDAEGFELLIKAFDSAEKNNVLLYDIMTERSSITSILQKELMNNKELFGELEKGSPDAPAIIKHSVHHFSKIVAGKPLIRPAWYFDTSQQGDGIVDVTTHLVDIVMWMCFGEQIIDYEKDVKMINARRWPTMITKAQYEKVTGLADFPDYLKEKLNDDGILPCYANGEMTYSLRGVHIKITAEWHYQAPEGGQDTHFSKISGTKSNLIIKQGKEQNYRPELYVTTADSADKSQLEKTLKKTIENLSEKFPGLALAAEQDGWHIIVPDNLRTGHESHFAEVVKRYLKYLKDGKIPAWEISFIKAKYYTITAALKLAMHKQIKITQEPDKINVLVNDKPFASYRFGAGLDKPILLPIYSPSGFMITRGWPVLQIEGETQDHPHHKGLWFAYRKVNDEDFWLEPASEAHIEHIKTTNAQTTENSAIISTVARWIDKDGGELLEEKRDMTFTANANEHIIDFDITLTALDKDVVFADHKDGLFAIQLADWLRETTGTAKYISSNGDDTTEKIWGKQTDWVRVQAEQNNHTIGVAVFCHPSSFGFPPYWHVRSYGLVAANPLGKFIFETTRGVENAKQRNLTLSPNQSCFFKFRLIIHEGPMSADDIDKKFLIFSKSRNKP
jgi:predicted dehydrogenase